MNVASKELCQELYGEEWAKIDGLQYQVSSLGNIRHINNKVNRKQFYNKDGYASVSYSVGGSVKNIHVHQIVAKYFVPHVDGKYHVNHKDSDPAHNCAHNLEWCTPGENVEHSRTHGKANRYQNRGEAHGMSKLSELEVRVIKAAENHVSNTQTAEIYGVSIKTIEDIRQGRRWKHVR